MIPSKEEKYSDSDNTSDEGGEQTPNRSIMARAFISDGVSMIRGSHDPTDPNFIAKDNGLSDSHLHGNEHEIVLITEEDTEVTKSGPRDSETSLFGDSPGLGTNIYYNQSDPLSSHLPTPKGSVHASSKFKDEKHEEPMTLEQASAMLDNARVTTRLSSTFQLMQEARKTLTSVEKEPVQQDNSWNIVFNAADIIKNRAINEEFDKESVSVISEEDTHEDHLGFNISNWASLQREIKDCFNFFETEEKLKEGITQNISNLSGQLLNFHIQVREATDRLKYKLRQEQWKEENVRKILMSDSFQVLGEADYNIKRMLFKIFENPKIIATIAKNDADAATLRQLDYSLCNHFFQSPTEDAKLEKNLLRFMTEILRIEFDKAKKPSDLFTNDSFTERILMIFLRRFDCRNYSKLLLKIPVLKIFRESYTLVMDLKNIGRLAKKPATVIVPKTQENFSKMHESATRAPMNQVKRATMEPIHQAPSSSSASTISIKALLNESLVEDLSEMGSSAVAEYARMLSGYYLDKQHSGSPSGKESPRKGHRGYFSKILEKNFDGCENLNELPTFTKKMSRLKNRRHSHFGQETVKTNKPLVSPEKPNEEKTTLLDALKKVSPVKGDQKDNKSFEAFELLTKDPEIAKEFEKNITKLTSYTNTFLASIFDNFHSMPISLRVICKIISMLAKEKFPNMTKQEHDGIFVNLLFSRWLLPYFLKPEFHDLVDDYSKNRATATEVSKLFKRILNQDLYPKDEPLSVLNDYISSFKHSIDDYFDQLVDVNVKLVENFIKGNNKYHDCPQKLQSRLLCLSLYEIEILVQLISKNLKQINEIDQEMPALIEELAQTLREKPETFGPKVDTKTRLRYRKDQVFVQYFELTPPKQSSGSYVEEFLRIQNYTRGMPEDERILVKCKHILKQILLATDDISDISMVAYDDEMTIEDILTFFQERVNSLEKKLTKSQSKTSVNLSSRFLLTYMTKLDSSYRDGGYHKLFSEIVKELRATVVRLIEKIRLNKMVYLRGLEMLKKRISIHKDITVKKHLAFQRHNIRDFLQDIRVPVCVRCPINPKGQHKKITIVNQKECIHGRLSLVNDLGSQTSTLSHLKDPKKMASFIGINQIKDSKEKEVHAHCTSVHDFINAYSVLPLVRYTMNTYSNYGDKYGAQETFKMYLDAVFQIVKENMERASEEELKLVLEEIETNITKRLYLKVYPVSDTIIDQAFWSRCRTLEWINFDQLDIPEKNRTPELWDYCSKLFAEIDHKLTPLGKLNCMLECYKSIAYVVALSSSRGDNASADDILPLFINVILKSFPRRMYSSLNFINTLLRPGRLLAEAGYCLTNVRSVVSFLENLEPSMIKLDKFGYEKLIYEKEVMYEINFLRGRKRTERQRVDLTEERQRYSKKDQIQPNINNKS